MNFSFALNHDTPSERFVKAAAAGRRPAGKLGGGPFPAFREAEAGRRGSTVTYPLDHGAIFLKGAGKRSPGVKGCGRPPWANSVNNPVGVKRFFTFLN